MSPRPQTPAPVGRTWLFVPGDRPERFTKAATSGADEVILDLEDAVAPSDKDSARDHVVTYLSAAAPGSTWVRLNGLESPWFGDDLAALTSAPGLRGVIVPKAETEAMDAAAAGIGGAVEMVALVESARGLQQAQALSALPGVTRLAFGSIDFALDIDAHEEDTSLLFARSSLVVASRAAGLAGPLDGVSVSWDRPDLVEADARRSRALGFAGKLCIHPGQIEPVAAAFAPTPEELAWAARTVAASQTARTGASADDGQMIDRPLLARAHRILGEDVNQQGETHATT